MADRVERTGPDRMVSSVASSRATPHSVQELVAAIARMRDDLEV